MKVVTDRLFVYGTLLPGVAPPGLSARLGRFSWVGGGVLQGRLFDLGRYPGVVLDPEDDHEVFGRVMLVATGGGAWDAIDAYEGYDPALPERSLFIRRRAPVRLSTSGSSESLRADCWVYVYNRPPGPAPLIEHGDYLRWVREGRIIG